MLELRNIYKDLGGRSVLRGVNLRVERGQTMVIVGSIPELGNGNQGTAQFMSLTNQDTGLWEYEVKLDTAADFTYRYFVKDDNSEIIIKSAFGGQWEFRPLKENEKPL